MKHPTNDVRKAFLDFFARNGHGVLPSSALVPHNDPTLMFTNAGMNQFKNIFTGVEKAPSPRAATSQKCVRAGGKHNDLDNVGYTARHHTFFEMLGNFSFGDYFKERAIELAWELLTKDYGLNPDKLCVTVYHDDDVAWNHWKKLTGFADHKIIRIATNDNFWSMGDTGPCGPCSEIFYDHGDNIAGGPPGSPDADGDRFVEIWNLVFMQYEQLEGGKRVELPKPSIDTGMGLERLSAVMQGVTDNYDIDLFKNLIAAIHREIGGKQIETGAPHKVIADHLRSSCFLIADGVLPSNEGRGYVLRRIMRRAMRYAHQLGCKDPLMYKLVPALVAEMSGQYPELKRAEATITDNLRQEEERFKQTLERGLKLLDEETAKLSKGQKLPGTEAFKLYDTFGFPLDLTQDILRGRGLDVDTDGFEKAMEGQRDMARAAHKGSGDTATGKIWFALKEKLGATEFVGYEKDEADAKILAIVQNGEEVQSANADSDAFLIFDRTPFYGESGGQAGDAGDIANVGTVIDTQKPVEDFHVHEVRLKAAAKVGDKVKLKLDVERRDATRANHSATHLLHKALRDLLGDHVTQKGSLVAHDRLRFDFSHPKALAPGDLRVLEDTVNAVVWRNTPVDCKVMAPDEAIKAGAMALFGEKYGDKVRVLSMGTHNGATYSTELCGGTHVNATGDIGLFKIISEGAVAAGIRRIEAVTRAQAFAHLVQQETLVKQLADSFKVAPDVLPERVAKLQDETKKLSKELAEAKKQLALGGGTGGGAAVAKEMIGDVGFIARSFDELNPKELRGIAEDMLSQAGPGIAVVASGFEGKASVVIAVSKEHTATHSAVTLVQAAVEAVGGKGGGGRPEMAQGGGPDASKLADAIEAVKARLAA